MEINLKHKAFTCQQCNNCILLPYCSTFFLFFGYWFLVDFVHFISLVVFHLLQNVFVTHRVSEKCGTFEIYGPLKLKEKVTAGFSTTTRASLKTKCCQVRVDQTRDDKVLKIELKYKWRRREPYTWNLVSFDLIQAKGVSTWVDQHLNWRPPFSKRFQQVISLVLSSFFNKSQVTNLYSLQKRKRSFNVLVCVEK